MKKQLYFILILLTLFSCTNQKPKKENFVQLNGKSLLRFHIQNSSVSGSLLFFYNTTFPFNQIKSSLIFDKDTLIEKLIELNHPVYVNLIKNKQHKTFFVIPNDTLEIYVNYNKSNLSEILRYEGKTGAISNYLIQKIPKCRVNYPLEEETSNEYDLRIDSLKKIAFNKFDSICQIDSIPEWCVDFEKINIENEAEDAKERQYYQRYFMYNQFLRKKGKTNTNIDFTSIEKYYFMESSNSVLDRFRAAKYDTLLHITNTTDKIFMQNLQDNINELKGKLSEEAISYFVASKTSILLSGNRLLRLSRSNFKKRTHQIDSFFNVNSNLITDTLILNYLINYKEKKYKEYADRKLLKTGKKAPVFSLESIVGERVQLSDFKGKLVLLNFWGTRCPPCIKSIPKKNELVEKYSSKDFVLINICTTYEYDRWKEIVEETDFKGIHLMKNAKTGKALSRNYNILGIPHYTLIDKNGNVIVNKVRDSLEIYIQANIE